MSCLKVSAENLHEFVAVLLRLETEGQRSEIERMEGEDDGRGREGKEGTGGGEESRRNGVLGRKAVVRPSIFHRGLLV